MEPSKSIFDRVSALGDIAADRLEGYLLDGRLLSESEASVCLDLIRGAVGVEQYFLDIWGGEEEHECVEKEPVEPTPEEAERFGKAVTKALRQEIRK